MLGNLGLFFGLLALLIWMSCYVNILIKAPLCVWLLAVDQRPG
jgi:hypothetical protein